jgi:formate dehydrogenase subunit gamma
MNEPRLKKYRISIRILHWLHTAVFLALAVTGIIIAASGGTTSTSLSSIHRVVAHLFIALPVVYLLIRPRPALRGIKILFNWGADDLAWLRAAPRYYLRHDDAAMPPQGFLNTGQKAWWACTALTWLLLAVSGLIKELLLEEGTSSLLQPMTALHNAAFGVAGVFFLVHVYLGLFHRGSREPLRSMLTGEVGADYARDHHGKWYDEAAAKPGGTA